ncbi:MAG TPA: hypothetical protein VJT73_10775 [Polyangiaceae bacterium]|nr:hypothetical protein [Polyangiaceae bacterium]
MNPFVVPALALVPFLGAPFRGSLELADRNEVRGGYFGFADDPTLNFETVPSLTLGFASHQSDVTFAYAPRIGLADLQRGINPAFLHSGFLHAAWRTRSVRVTFDEYASYGFLNYSAARLPGSAVPGTMRVDPLVRAHVDYEASATAVNVFYVPVPRVSLRFLASYSVNGGATESARRVIPLQNGPRLETVLDYALTPTDRSLTALSFEKSSLSTGYDYLFLQASEGLAHRFSARTRAEVALGAARVKTSLPPPFEIAEWNTYMTVSGVVGHQIPFRDMVAFLLRAQYAPAVNRFTGRVSQQLQGILNATWQTNPWLVTLEGGLADTLRDEAGALSVVSGLLSLGFRLNRQVTFEGGASLAWQKVGGADPLLQKLAFVAVTLRGPTLRF